ncbi:uncharacterized protein TRIADDRAFT_51901 [Trichoplax adhaerens]|uniref:Kringle domain-containing protein n=1 Tax=Trichoplax adhaerens TaxID=10228 RepID=B3RL72_TRIAD|nr:hypothetical protein TRIADDRAFT_51901 [Trichoplax adhaerens]EDV28710.1 hypothetical protein TRIADDRAFT_51901 [Trichoplax adhaerens]|eukprot:XP_002107912.1 hypothetical protein TRIADDRAFT_51901 [Trichoplax adhaerens]
MELLEFASNRQFLLLLVERIIYVIFLSNYLSIRYEDKQNLKNSLIWKRKYIFCPSRYLSLLLYSLPSDFDKSILSEVSECNGSVWNLFKLAYQRGHNLSIKCHGPHSLNGISLNNNFINKDVYRKADEVDYRASKRHSRSANTKRPVDPTCYFGNGSLYQGVINVTIDGEKCLPWHIANRTSYRRSNSFFGQDNFCRNPNGERTSPWCYVRNTTTSGIGWAYCPIPKCLQGQPTLSTLLQPEIKSQTRVRLSGNNSNRGIGRVDIQFNSTWGSICAHGWTFSESSVVCRQLGYIAALPVEGDDHF